MYHFRLVVQTAVFDLTVTSSMSSSIFTGFKDGVLFAIFADYQMIYVQVRFIITNLQNMLRYTGKPICVTSFSGILHADLPCGAEKSTIVGFSTRAANHPRGIRVNGNDTCISEG